jgi:hypothetical protein
VKQFCADDSAATSVKVGYRQACYKKKTPLEIAGFFCVRIFMLNKKIGQNATALHEVDACRVRPAVCRFSCIFPVFLMRTKVACLLAFLPSCANTIATQCVTATIHGSLAKLSGAVLEGRHTSTSLPG